MIRYSVLLTSIFAVFAMLTVFSSINTIQYRLYKRNTQFYPCNNLESNATTLTNATSLINVTKLTNATIIDNAAMIDNAIIRPNPSIGKASVIMPIGDINITSGDRFIFEIKHNNNTLIFQNGTDICNNAICPTKEDVIEFTTSIPELPRESSEYYMVIRIESNVTESILPVDFNSVTENSSNSSDTTILTNSRKLKA
ncbi:5659_t:CDS:1, partial [Cetraspora pellucida]